MFSSIDFNKLQNLFLYDPQNPLYFSTSFFLFFMFALLLVYRLAGKNKSIKIFTIIFFSLFFYYKNSGYFFLLLFFSTLANFYFGNWLYKTKSLGLKRTLFWLSLFIDIGLLIYFKYTNFLLRILTDIHAGHFNPLDILLPVGISFYTFKAMSYVIELYIGSMNPTESLRDFTLYMFFFPNILAGPIDRAAAFIPQIEREEFTITKEDMGRAVFLILCGLFKKNVIADYIGLNFVDRVFQVPLRFTGVENLLSMYAYAIQIYCDFSGYTDMALGIGLLLGFKLMDNFNIPFKASSVADYWRRWHISLSTWLLDYLFKPLQLKFRNLRIYGSAIAIFITFFIVGLWHGANWTFVVFGLLHSTYLSFSLLTQKWRNAFYDWLHIRNSKILKFFQILFTFHLLMFTGVFFRAATLKDAFSMFHQIFTFFHGIVFFQFVVGYEKVFILMMLGYALHFIPKKVDFQIQNLITKVPVYVQALLIAIMIIIVYQAEAAQLQPFIYFNF